MCSLLESVLLSVTQVYIAMSIKEGKRSGRFLKELKRRINHPLSAILMLNTIANVAGAAGVSTQVYSLYGKEWVALVSGIFTILILVFSEIIPKTLGAVHWMSFAPFAAYLLKGMIVVTYPFVNILEGISRFVAGKKHHTHITREEIFALAEIGENEGILHEKEARIIENILLLDTIRTEKILTPRAVVFGLPKQMTVDEVIKTNSPIPFSRIPVYGENLDEIAGYVLRKELLEAYNTGGAQKKMEELMSPIFAVPESKTVAGLLDEFISRREHIFLVIDEYGGTAGIVTMEDAIETLLGVEIMDELDSVEDMREFALERWKKRHAAKS
jgi:CBS domain containing-hemolysin-like protein